MHYLIYKITNRLNNKFYVGKHKTENKDDDYFGSGILIERAISKHGKENFVKEILFDLPTEEEMNQKEADIVDEDFVARDDTYNLKLGGQGGYDYINSTRKNIYQNHNRTPARRLACSIAQKNRIEKMSDAEFEAWTEKTTLNFRRYEQLFGYAFTGKKHSAETKDQMRKSHIGKHVGKLNGSFGTHWITNGIKNARVKRDLPIPSGWKTGRTR